MKYSLFLGLWQALTCFFMTSCEATSANQTADLSPIFSQDSLPFTIGIEQESFSLPNGLHSYVSAIYDGKWLLLAGRTNGLHGFENTDDNFPPRKQNTVVYVVDPLKQTVHSRGLDDPTSGLTQEQIDLLSVTSAQSFQDGKTLYISGGYGVDSSNGEFSTKSALTAIDIPLLMKWVKKPTKSNAAHLAIRQTFDPILQVTGGYMTSVDSGLTTLLIFGQNFTGYYTDSSNGNYTQQVRRFKIVDNGRTLQVVKQQYFPSNPNYRRRDLNVVPIIQDEGKAFVALSGVFTLDTGIWTVPVTIQNNGDSYMPDPSLPDTFKQGMNNYVCPTASLYDSSKKNMYILLMGGISFGYFSHGVFKTNAEIPFINQVTTVKINKHGHYTQYLMDNKYPVIRSTWSNPGRKLLFGAGAAFFPSDNISTYSNGVIKFNKIKASIVLGYIVGGIMSTMHNTQSNSDSAASPYIFKVILYPKWN